METTIFQKKAKILYVCVAFHCLLAAESLSSMQLFHPHQVCKVYTLHYTIELSDCCLLSSITIESSYEDLSNSETFKASFSQVQPFLSLPIPLPKEIAASYLVQKLINLTSGKEL